ncbi:MAG: EAL domain-containing protein [Gallionellaceae bacterium]|nr:MAG: EAL domain-containing protein [Gallionellaceae bacterium]
MPALFNSIRTKIAIALSLIVVAIFTVYTLRVYEQARLDGMAELDELSARMASRLSANLDLPLWEVDSGWITKIIDTEMSDKHVYAIFVIGDNRQFLGKARNEQWQPVARSGNNLKGDFITRDAGILHDGRKIGSVKIFIAKKFMDEDLERMVLRQVLVAAVLVAVLLGTIAVLLSRIVLKPLRSVLETTGAIARGDYSRDAAVEQHDEIGLLATGINAMKDSLQSREAERDSALRQLRQQSLELGHANIRLEEELAERKLAEMKIRNLNRVYAVLSNINKAIVRMSDPAELFDTACKIAVADGQFSLAWVGTPDLERKLLRVTASAGMSGVYLDDLHISLQNDEFGRGPTGTAYREGRSLFCNDIEHDPRMQPWRGKLLEAGLRSSIALPIKVRGGVRATFSCYAAETDFFDEQELKLLDEMVADVGFAFEVWELDQERRQAETAAREREERFRLLFQSMLHGVVYQNERGEIIAANPAAERILGLSLEQMQGRTPIDPDWRSIHEDGATFPAEQHPAMVALRTGKAVSDVIMGVHNPQLDALRWLNVSAVPQFKADESEPYQVFTTFMDVTERKLAEDRLRQSAAIIDSTREGVIVTDPDNRIVMVNHAFSDITGYAEQEVRDKTPSLLASGQHDHEFYAAMWAGITGADHWQGEIWNRRKNGEVYPELLSINAVRDEHGKLVNYVGVFADISKLKASEERLDFLAHHDPLTRLPNRLLMNSRIEHAIEVAARDQQKVALLVIDLDRFKDVNDSYGHAMGDELLQQVADRLSSRLRSVDTLTRLGGDEFTVLLEGVAHDEDAARVANDIITALSEPWWLSNGAEISVGASVGISLFPEHGGKAPELFQHADAALYQAKAEGRGRYKYFTEAMTRNARARIDMENKLRDALDWGDLCVYYQPQVDIASGRITGAEALVRWLDKQQGLISPAQFIPLAEETGLIGRIGEFVLRETCRQGRRWLDAGYPRLTLAVNLSPRQIQRTDIGTLVNSALADSGFPAASLELELTESALMEREEEAIAMLNQLRAIGVHLAIDDFGTGYSSLSYLKRFPLDILKIDKSFVDDIPFHQDDMEIAAAIISMGHSLGFKILAEGVETVEQLDFLTKQGCDMYQGYLKSKPLPAIEFERLLASGLTRT